MSDRSFFDTNILVYADDKATPAKQRRAIDLVAEHRRAGTDVLSLQVLQEYFVTFTRKLHVDAKIARRKLNCWPNSILSFQTSTTYSLPYRLHGFSSWDALVLRAAKQGACIVLLSEDLQPGRVIDGVQIVNPFV